MSGYFSEFLALAGLHLLAVMSPGPDFALVLRQSIGFGRTTGIASSVGIGTGILVHIAYSQFGIGVFVKSSLTAFTVMKLLGGAYLMWIGIQALRSRPRSDIEMTATQAAPTIRKAFVTGFLTNATNVKATLFFLSVFSVLINPLTPRWLQIGYGLWMAVVTAAWFCLVSIFFTQARVRRAFVRFGHWFDRLMGGILIALGLRLALAQR